MRWSHSRKCPWKQNAWLHRVIAQWQFTNKCLFSETELWMWTLRKLGGKERIKPRGRSWNMCLANPGMSIPAQQHRERKRMKISSQTNYTWEIARAEENTGAPPHRYVFREWTHACTSCQNFKIPNKTVKQGKLPHIQIHTCKEAQHQNKCKQLKYTAKPPSLQRRENPSGSVVWCAVLRLILQRGSKNSQKNPQLGIPLGRQKQVKSRRM